jgi:hypothetical protein
MTLEPACRRRVELKVMRCASIVIAVVLAGCANMTGERPAPLTRAEIVRMAQAGEPPGNIIERLQATQSVIFLSATEILELNRQGVQPEVLEWMQREQVRELRRRDAFDFWSYDSPFSRCIGWSGRWYPQPFMFRSPYWPYCY